MNVGGLEEHHIDLILNEMHEVQEPELFAHFAELREKIKASNK